MATMNKQNKNTIRNLFFKSKNKEFSFLRKLTDGYLQKCDCCLRPDLNTEMYKMFYHDDEGEGLGDHLSCLKNEDTDETDTYYFCNDCKYNKCKDCGEWELKTFIKVDEDYINIDDEDYKCVYCRNPQQYCKYIKDPENCGMEWKGQYVCGAWKKAQYKYCYDCNLKSKTFVGMDFLTDSDED